MSLYFDGINIGFLCTVKLIFVTAGSMTMLAYEMQTSEAADDIGGVSGSGPASNFRDAATEGVGMWGPIMGGVVVVGGAIAVVGTLLHEDGTS
jgi:hypothetical protein